MRISSDIRTAAPAVASPRPVLPTVSLAGLAVHAVSEDEAIGFILEELLAGRGGWVITPNLDHLHRFRRDREFASYFSKADLVVADGMPLIWASRLKGTPIPERVSGSSLIWTLPAAAAAEGRSIFLLGGMPGTAELAGQALCQKYPGLRIAGTACPPIGFDANPAEVAKLREQLEDARPDIVFVALGSPKQERLIARIKEGLPQAWWLGVGISFSFVCGQVRRAPVWMQRLGLEWVHRLVQEPGRLARRYLVDDLPFAFVLLTGSFFGRFRSERYSRARRQA